MISLIIFAYLVIPVHAGAYDGVYNYAYNLNGPNGWETHRVDSGFIVRNGVISSNPAALSGTVDSSGNVYFTGPSPYGGPSAVFTGAIYSDGTGKGYYTDSQGLQGAWSVSRVSGSGSDWASIIMDVMDSFAFIGEIFGATGATAAGIGTAVAITVFVSIISLASSSASKAQNAKRTGQYTATQTDSPQREQGIPPSTIDVPPPPILHPQELALSHLGYPTQLN